MQTFSIKSLDQARLLTDPFKLMLLEHFSQGPITTKQVADALGEKAPKLYRHVDALVAAGLLELVEERPKRGTVERYYKAVAQRYELDPDLFDTKSGTRSETVELVRSLFRDAQTELLSLDADSIEDLPFPPIVLRISGSGSLEAIERLSAKLQDWIEECADLNEESADTDQSFAGLVAFYPRKQSGTQD
jgi:predicted ArsR family transcriptional regulator